MTDMRKTRLFMLALAVLSSAAAGLAHDTWIALERRGDGTPYVTVTSGMEFPKLDHAIAADRVAEAKRRAGESVEEPMKPLAGANALELPFAGGDGDGVYWVVLHPRPSRISEKDVRDYVDHLGIADPESAIEEWSSGGGGELLYRYVKYAKTVAGSPTDVARPVGMRLELVPLERTAGTAKIRLIDGGAGRGHYPVWLVAAGEEARRFETDPAGEVELPLEGKGPWMIRSTVLERSADPEHRWDVHFTTLTLGQTPRRTRSKS